ncbi:MAG: TonB-dependent receptor [Alphaproteobacteria bacterium]|nr:MAG: TonB-dependent receptor [Alphaproteobacteria bacterium]
MTTRFHRGISVTAMAIAMAAQPVWAQADADNAGDDKVDFRLEEIIVSAQRRSESLQDVPVTVTAFGATEIEQAKIQQIDDIVTRTPGLSFDAFPSSQARLYIRGIGSSDRGAAGDPSAAVFLDDIYLGRPAAIAFDAFDVERIEVMKGPQGTLYGRNVVGGAINVITKKPDLDEASGALSATVGNYNRLDGAGYANIPLSEGKSALRISGSYRSHGGYVENLYLDQDVEDQDTLSGRLQFFAMPSEALSFLLTVDATRDRALAPANHVLELDTSNPLSNFYSQNFDPDVTYGSDPGYQNRDTYGIRAEISNDFSFGTLSFLGSYRDLDYSFRYDFDGGNPDPDSPGFNAVAVSGGNDEKAKMSSQEVRLSALPESKVSWVVGLYHYAHDVDRSDILELDSFLIAPIPLTEKFVADASLDSYAAFGDATVPVGERWSVFAGLRYSRDKKTQRAYNTDSMAPLRADEFYDVTAEKSFDDWTYRMGVEFEATPDHMFYASISRGYKSGGFNDTASNAVGAATPFEAETAVQYEIGQKSTFLDGSLIWNNTLYYMDYSNLQTGQTVDGKSITSNAGKAHIKGFETQLTANVSEGLYLSFAYAYTDAIFDEFVENEVDYSGNRISRSPKHKLTVSPSYTTNLPGLGADLTFAVDYRYASKIFDDNSNLPPEFRDPTHFVDARIILDGFSNGMSLSIWGKNLTDERTRTFQGGFLGANFGAFSPPMTFGATLGLKF